MCHEAVIIKVFCKNTKNLQKNLAVSEKLRTFAPAFDKTSVLSI